MKKILPKIIFVFMITFFVSNQVFASGSDVIFDFPDHSVQTGVPFSVKVLIENSDESINAIEGVLHYDPAAFKFVDIVDGDSVVTAWVEKPQATEEGKIIFSGIMAGGYLGTIYPLTNTTEPGILFELILIPNTSGSEFITLSDTVVYKNDGLGTAVYIATKRLEIVSGVDGYSNYIEVVDDIRPLVFSPIISKNEDVFEGRYFLVFDTQDKESGIDHFEVKEGRGGWIVASSPYVLEDQSLKSRIKVKAIDKSGNERIVNYGDKTYFPVSVFAIPTLIVVLILVYIYVWYTRKIRALSVK